MERGAGGRSRGGVGAVGEGGRSVAEVQLFREDVVQSVAQPSMVGVVSKVGGDSDSEDSSEEEEEDEEEVSEGAARVCWINTDESTEKVGDLRVIDRAFLHGDIVAKATDPLGHTGTVVNVEMMVDLELPNAEIQRDVNSRRLRRVRAFALGDYVIYDMWIGRVEEVYDNVTVMFDDGAKCKLSRADPDRLRPLNETVIDDSGCPYFQGQKVRADSSSIFKSAKWLKGSWKASRTEGTVVELEAGTVVVYWIAAGNALNGNTQPSAVPNEEVDASKVLPMIYFSHTNWQLGDRSLPPTRMRPSSVVPTEGSQVDGIPSDGDAESSLDNNNVTRCPDTVDLNSCGTGESCSKGGSESWTLHRRKGKQQRRAVKRDKKLQKKEKPIEYAVLIVSTRTTVDVLWQDGRISKAVDACSLIPVDHLGDHDFWPEQYVMERGADGEGSDDGPRRVGVVKVVDAKQRTASVRWLKIVNRPEEAREFESEEVVSVYELVEHPDYSYCLGDVVIRLISAPSASEPPVDDSQFAASSGIEDTSEADAEDHDRKATRRKQRVNSAQQRALKVEPSPHDLSWVGVIIGLQDGDIEVAWADGMVSKVGPQAIWVVNRDLGDSSSAHTSDLEDAEDIDDARSWETVVSDDDDIRGNQGDSDEQAERLGLDHKNDIRLGNEEDLGAESRSDASVDHDDDGNGAEEHRAQNLGGPFKLPFQALGLVSRFATGLLGLRGGKKDVDLVGGERASSSESKQGLEDILDEDAARGQQTPTSPTKWSLAEERNLCQRDTLQRFTDTVLRSMGSEEQEQDLTASSTPTDAGSEEQELSPVDPFTKIDDDEDKGKFADAFSTMEASPEGDNLPEMGNMIGAIKHFDCVKDPSDHHFITESAQPSNRRKWAKKIQQEWSILEKNLPDTIYVRVYEDRMDLLRAVIVGAKQTPYHDGLFVFDLYMPPDYPIVPPLAHYHSGGLRLNPNLYENGKVCLSLLNTWTGRGSEMWHPSTSSILQVLVSIQGLVLNERPYFNEAGYDKQVGTGEGEKNSSVYNENSFLLSCKSMLYLLRRPPMHFEDLIRDHFQKRGNNVLLACKAYLAGAEVGSLTESDLSGIEDRRFDDQSSAGFKLMLNKLVPKLTAAFEEMGAKSIDPLRKPSSAQAGQDC